MIAFKPADSDGVYAYKRIAADVWQMVGLDDDAWMADTPYYKAKRYTTAQVLERLIGWKENGADMIGIK